MRTLRQGLWLCWVALVGSQMVYAAGAQFRPELPAYFAVRTDAVPTLDGKLDDSCWQAAPPANDFRVLKVGEPAVNQTQFRVLWDDQALYLGITAFGDFSAGPTIRRYRRDEGVWGDDSMEIFLDPGRTEGRYFHLGVNAANVQADEVIPGGGIHWDGEWQSAVQVSNDRFTLELALPWPTFEQSAPTAGRVWGLGLDRNEPRGDKMHYSGWSLGPQGFHAPHYNGYLFFGTTQEHLSSLAERANRELLEMQGHLTPAELAVAPQEARDTLASAEQIIGAAQERADTAEALSVAEWAPLARKLTTANEGLEAAIWRIRIWGLLLLDD